MVVTTTPRTDPLGPAPERVLSRFDRVERAVHWTNAALFLFLLATGYTLAGAPGTGWIGNRRSVVELHTYVGYALPFPVLLGIATHIGRQLREDLHRFARWTADDSRWWHKSTRRKARIGKFNPGQKLNAVFIGASIIVMPATGTFLRWPAYFPHSFVDGADFTHRWFALAILIVTVGHIAMALSRPSSLRGMFTGKVPENWARSEHPRWHAEVTSDTD
ncbi:MAG TPA: cytochrome b/b6 domain-containing protein [Acidimicrobiia bacterium]|jgi:formate dehydrogenase subunit gamma